MRAGHYGWVIVACAFLMLTITNGPIIGAGLTIFDRAILGEFGWSRGALEFREFLTLMLAGVAAPVVGAIADRHGVRVLMLLGVLMLAAGQFAYSQMASLAHLYLIHVAFGIALACAGLVVCMMLVSRWFVARRGLAIGLALVGTSVGSIVFPKLNIELLQSSSWRSSFQTLALITLGLVPVILVFVREWPADRGLAPYGASAGTPATTATAPGGMSYGEAMRTRRFWTLAIIAMSTFYTAVAVLKHLFLYLTDSGFDPRAATQRIIGLAVFMLLGKFLFGYLADRIQPTRVLVGGLLAMLAGSACLASLQASLFWPFALCFGLGWGGLYTMIQLLVMTGFGLKASGKILGTLTVLDAFGGGLGPWLTGVLFDATGSYRLPFLVITGLLGVALALSLTLRPAAAQAQHS